MPGFFVAWVRASPVPLPEQLAIASPDGSEQVATWYDFDMATGTPAGEVTARDAEYAAARLAETLASRKAKRAGAVKAKSAAPVSKPAAATVAATAPPVAKVLSLKQRPVLRLPAFRTAAR